MSVATLLALLTAALADAPELVRDVEDIVAAFKSGGHAAAKGTLEAKVLADTGPLAAKLQGLP